MEDPTEAEIKQEKTVSRFKEMLPQLLAMSAANCLVLNMAVIFFMSTLVIADLHNTGSELAMDDTQASWFGGLPYMCQPIGSIASGFLANWLGRKKSLMLLTIPYILSCILMSTAHSIAVLFLTNVIIGISVGLTEAPVNNYFGEICQPKFRSILAGSASMFYNVGMFVELLLGSFLHWRTSAAVSAIIPAITFIMISQIPESPIWLIAHGRKKDAENALCWLRGWVHPNAIQKELQELVSYHENVTMKSISKTSTHKQYFDKSGNEQTVEQTSFLPQKSQISSGSVQETEQLSRATDRLNTTGENKFLPQINGSFLKEEEDHPESDSNILAKLKLFLEPATFRPLFLTLLIFVLVGLGGMISIRPFIVEVLHRFKAPIDEKLGSVVLAVAGLLGGVTMITVINLLGKRKLALTATATCAASCLLLGLYACLIIAPANSTGDPSYLVATWLPLTLFVVLSFSSTIQGHLPWYLVVEVFPFRTRGVASGFAAAFAYLMAFVASKTYLETEHTLQLHGTFFFFGTVNCICFLYLFFQLPETEGKSLLEIESLFAEKKRRSGSTPSVA